MAFNPLIPGDADASGIPAAFLEVGLENNTGKTLLYTVAFSLANPFEPEQAAPSRVTTRCNATDLVMGCRGIPENSIRYGDTAVATDAAEISYQSYWYRGNHRFSGMGTYWLSPPRAGCKTAYTARMRRCQPSAILAPWRRICV